LELPIIPFFQKILPDFRLPWDGHPNAETQGAMALWVARSLIDAGWLGEDAEGDLPPVAKRFRALRSRQRSQQEVLALSRQSREEALSKLGDRVSFETWQGLLQVFGGIGFKGQATTGMTLLLKASGRNLQVRLRALPEEVDIYPLEVVVQVADTRLGSLWVRRGEVAVGKFPLPAEVALGSAIEVRLQPQRWGLVHLKGVPQAASFLPLSIAAPAVSRE
jgi:hypothetical protein